MKYIYEVTACCEYAWQDVHGLYDSLEAARASIPDHTEVVFNIESLVIVALPEHAQEVREAVDRADQFWWYTLPRHGRTEDWDSHVFFGIHRRPVHTLEDVKT